MSLGMQSNWTFLMLHVITSGKEGGGGIQMRTVCNRGVGGGSKSWEQMRM